MPADSTPPERQLEADLRAAREAKGISLDAIQRETRIPADVLARFEEGRLLGDPAFNEVYLRALLRAYAHAVGLQAADVVAGYDAQREGAYRGLAASSSAQLSLGLGGGAIGSIAPATPAPPPAPVSRVEASAAGVGVETPSAAPPEATPGAPGRPATLPPAPAPLPRAPSAAAPAPAVAALAAGPSEPSRVVSPALGPNEHFPKRRVARAEAAATPRAFDRSWGLVIGAAGVAVVVFGTLLWWMFRGSRPEPEERPARVAAADTARADSTRRARPPATPAASSVGPRFATPIRVTAVARGNGLQSFRVTEAPGERQSYWMETGGRQTYESSQEVVLWGEGSTQAWTDATLEWQGLRWTPPDGRAVRINAATGQRLLDSLVAAGPAAPPVP